MGMIGGQRVRRTLGVTAIGLMAGAGVGCAQESSGADLVTAGPADFAATPDYLGEVVTQSTGQAFRLEFSMSMHIEDRGETFDLDLGQGTGAQDGDRYQMSFDFAEMFEAIAADSGGDFPDLLDDPTMEMVGDDTVVHIRAPFFAGIADRLPTDVPPDNVDGFAMATALSSIGDRWGRIDLTALDDLGPMDPRSAPLTGQSFDPMVLFELVADAEEVEDVGEFEIGDLRLRGLAAAVPFADLLEAQGMDADDYLAPMGEGLGAGPEVVEALAELEMPIEVWIDEDGLVRRLEFGFGLDQIEDLAEAAGEHTVPPDEFQMTIRFDFSDYGDESIDIEFPDDSETVDITDDYRAAFEDL